MLNRCKRLLAALLVLAAGALPVRAQPDAAFCDFLIDAAGMDVRQAVIQVRSYEAAAGGYQAGETAAVSCALNRVTQDASFYIQPGVDGVSVTADYLTDLDGDGVYERLAGREVSLAEDLTIGAHAAPDSGSLIAGQTYILSAQTLLQGSQAEVQARAQLLGMALPERADAAPLCLVSLRYTPAGGTEQALSYYLQLYGPVIMPGDVSPDSPYYDAVEYVLAQGYFAGVDADTFQPSGAFTRAQLAQILWRLGGSLPSSGCSFSDVDTGDWYYDAVSWCYQNGIMTGFSADSFSPDTPLSQQQMALILYQYARHTGAPTQEAANLSAVPGGDGVSVWARSGMEWAAAYGLLPLPTDDQLRPSADVTREEMAMVLYTYDQLFVNQEQPETLLRSAPEF